VKANMHIPSGFGMKRICAVDSSLNGDLRIVRGDGTLNVMEKFWEALRSEAEYINGKLENPAKMIQLTKS